MYFEGKDRLKHNIKEKNIKNRSNIFIILIFIVTLLMGIVYASINSISLNIVGDIEGKIQEGVFITDVEYKESSNVTIAESKINNMYQTVLNSSIGLSKTSGTSTVTYTITILNSTSKCYEFEGVKHANSFYDNTGITYTLNGLEVGDALYDQDKVVFDITFSYVNGTVASNNILNSYLNFDFVESDKVKAMLTYNGEIVEKKLVDPSDGTVTFAKTTVTDGVVARTNNGATPVFNENTRILSATGINKNTNCMIFDTLKESVETSDASVNNMLMIANENATENMTLQSGKTTNLNLNGKTINSTLSSNIAYIKNNGNLKIYDSSSTGLLKTNYTLIENAGTLTINSGKYTRANTSTNTGRIITNTAGTLTINGGTFTSDGTHGVYAENNSNAKIKNATFNLTINDSNAISNYTNNGIISIINCTIVSTQGGGVTCGGNKNNRVYIAKCNISAGMADFATNGGRIHYTADTFFTNGTNSPISYREGVGTDYIVKNYIKNATDDWYYAKDSSGNKMTYSDGSYMLVGDPIYIKSYGGLALDVAAANYTSGTNIQLYTSNNTAAQTFTLLASGATNRYNIAPYCAPTLFLDIAAGSTTNGTNIGLYTSNDTSAQRFTLIKSGSYIKLKSNIGTFIDTDEGTNSPTSGTNVESWAQSNDNSQLWSLIKK